MSLSFARASHYAYELFWDPNILITITSIVTHSRLVKKNHNQVENFDSVKVLNGTFVHLCLFLTT